MDVLVIGGGNAALCAALMAREAGASVMLLEAAPREWRGGNSMHTRNLRCMHDAPQDVLTGAYPEEEFWQDLLKVTGGKTHEALARMVIRESATVRPWMRSHGVRFQPSLSGTLHLSRTNAFFMAAARRWSMRTIAAPKRWGWTCVTKHLCRSWSWTKAALWPPILPQGASQPKPACWPAAALSPTANGCAKPGGKTHRANGRPTTF